MKASRIARSTVEALSAARAGSWSPPAVIAVSSVVATIPEGDPSAIPDGANGSGARGIIKFPSG